MSATRPATDDQALLDTMEALRAEHSARRNRRIPWALAILVVLIVIAALIGHQIAWIAALALGLGLLGWVSGPAREYTRRFKESVLPTLAQSFGDFDYRADSCISPSLVERYRILPSHDRCSGEDHFIGRYRDVGVEFSEVVLKERRGSGKNKRWVTVFRGLFVRLEMNKRFEGETILRRDAGAVGNWLSGAFQAYERVRLEDPRFEERFEVFSTDQVEARVLLTPAFMERLVRLEELQGTDKLTGCFFDESLFLALPNPKTDRKRDRFEPPPLAQPIESLEEFDRLRAEIRAVLDLVDALKLDERTGV